MILDFLNLINLLGEKCENANKKDISMRFAGASAQTSCRGHVSAAIETAGSYSKLYFAPAVP